MYGAAIIAFQIFLICFFQILLIGYFNKISNNNPLSDVGFIYFTLLFSYIFFPGIGIILAAIGDDFFQIALGDPSLEELYEHQWRQIIFYISSIAGYLIFRDKFTFTNNFVKVNKLKNPHAIIIFIFVMIVLFIVVLGLLSSTVENYYEGYTRYDHLNYVARRILSIVINLKFGFYAIALVIFYQNYTRYRFAMVLFSLFICTFEIFYSYGSRIEAFKILLMLCCLYSVYVSKINILKIVLILIALMSIFSLVEIVRSSMINESDFLTYIYEVGVKPAQEFGSLYFTGFKLYELRTSNALPSSNPLMFIYDFISIIPFVNFDEINPMVWYAKNFYPDAIVPPFTLGPIAISAIYGGEIDLIIRGFILASIISLISNWFNKNYKSWVAATIYVYFYSTVVMLLKYDIFWFSSTLVKLLFPSIFIIYFLDLILEKFRKVNSLNEESI